RILALHQTEPSEQSAEGQDFGSQEQPHTNLAGIELLLHGGEVMLMMRIMLSTVPVRILMNINRCRTHAFTLIRALPSYGGSHKAHARVPADPQSCGTPAARTIPIQALCRPTDYRAPAVRF